jgi:hypothetical protein
MKKLLASLFMTLAAFSVSAQTTEFVTNGDIETFTTVTGGSPISTKTVPVGWTSMNYPFRAQCVGVYGDSATPTNHYLALVDQMPPNSVAGRANCPVVKAWTHPAITLPAGTYTLSYDVVGFRNTNSTTGTGVAVELSGATNIQLLVPWNKLANCTYSVKFNMAQAGSVNLRALLVNGSSNPSSAANYVYLDNISIKPAL